jgi:L-gulonate 3-dehydrogenase
MSQNIACVGVGNIGRAWAAIFARAGHRVALYDDAPAALDAALPAIADNLAAMEQEGLAEDAAAALARIRVCRSLAEALAG